MATATKNGLRDMAEPAHASEEGRGMRQLFLIHVWGDVDPIVSGPYENEDEVFIKACKLHNEDEGCIFALDVTVSEAGQVTIEATPFTDEELGDPDEFCDSCGASIGSDEHTEEDCEYAEAEA